MKQNVIWSAVMLVVVIVALVAVRKWEKFQSSEMAGYRAMHEMSDEEWRELIARDPTEQGYSGYGILEKRGSDIAIEEAIEDIESDDAYVWLNAASYLGGHGREEAIPFLIKSLRHSAWRSVEKRVEYLERIAGQSFGNDFEKWRVWYESQDSSRAIDWESSLGHAPRIGDSPAPPVEE